MKETKQERREKRRAREKAKTLQHGGSLRRMYRDAVSKRARSVEATGNQSEAE
jgi:muconolactone delta-isomerase